ncbi:hypothetical protein [Fodinicurvata halophila]
MIPLEIEALQCREFEYDRRTAYQPGDDWQTEDHSQAAGKDGKLEAGTILTASGPGT